MTTTITARPNVLTQFAEQRGWTQLRLAEVVRLDRKTLTKINRGLRVKVATLQQVADALKVPLTHLQAANAPGPDPILPAHIGVEQLDALATTEVLIRSGDPERFRSALNHCGRVRWHLGIADVSEPLATTLEEFEACVESLRLHLNVTPADSDISPDQHSLRKQLEAARGWMALAEKLKFIRSSA